MRSILVVVLAACAPAAHAVAQPRDVVLSDDPERLRLAAVHVPPEAPSLRLLGPESSVVRAAVRRAEAALASAPLDTPRDSARPPDWARLLHALSMAYGGRLEAAAAGHESLCPGGEACADALEASSSLRWALGERAQAREDWALHERAFGLGIAPAVAVLEESEERRAAQWLAWSRRPDASEGDRLIARRALLRDARGQTGLTEARAIERMWAARSNGAALTVEPSALELCAVAEARFALARALGERALGTSLPAFVGPATTERLVRYAERVLRPWLDRRWARTERAEAAYRRSAEVGCLQWTIAAARAMGDLRLDVAHAIQTIPPPTELADDANTDGCPGEPAWRPLEAAAEAHYRTCLELAVAHRWPSDDSRSCAEALSELNRAGYPAAQELVPTRAFFDAGLGALTPTALLP